MPLARTRSIKIQFVAHREECASIGNANRRRLLSTVTLLTERILLKPHTKILSVGKILSFNIKPGGKNSNHGDVKDSSVLPGVYFLLLFLLFC